jgi:gas vesicle protein
MEGMRDALSRTGLVQSSTTTWLTGFAIGAGFGLVAGATVAMLITPKSGPEMRHELGSKAKMLAERTQGTIAGVAEGVKEKLGEVERHRGRNELPVS